MQSYQLILDSPIGPLTVIQTGKSISGLYIQKKGNDPAPNSDSCILSETPLLRKASQQLQEYFNGKRQTFSLPLCPIGTEFQEKCWNALLNIPYGETRSYKEIAIAIGNEKACRAVGMANHNNPISILIPCHRVIGANGSLVGYGGGLPVKKFLLQLEQKFKNQPNPL